MKIINFIIILVLITIAVMLTVILINHFIGGYFYIGRFENITSINLTR